MKRVIDAAMSPLDYTLIVLYLGVTIALAVGFRGRQSSARDYFIAEGGLRGFFGSVLIGFSIAATLFSGISLLAYPSIFYTNGAVVFVTLVSFPLFWLVLRYWFLPRFFARQPHYPYQIIEDRFGMKVRLLASGMFVALRVGWMSVLIYAPSLIVITAAGLDEGWLWPVIILIGGACTLYTTAGGIRGVIVTDAMQFAIMLFGVLFVIGYILLNIGLSPAELVAGWKERGQWRFFDFSLDPTKAFTVWTLGIGVTLSGLSSYVGDQMSLQRYLTSGSLEAAKRSFAFNVVGAGSMVALLAVTGMLLSAWYAHFPDSALPEAGDKVFPHFIATVLPSGVTGLIIAAVLAATMSSLTSGVNSLAGCLTNDFILPTGWIQEGRPLLFCGRCLTVVVGAAATVGAGFVGRLGTIFDIAQKLYGVFMGPLLACMVLAILPIRVRTWTLVAGPLIGVAAGVAGARSEIAPAWTSTCAFLAAMLLPMLSLLLGIGRRQWG